MTLREFLDKNEGNVKLGAKGGASFIYCGPIKSIDLEAIETILTMKTRRLLQNADRALLTAQEMTLDEETYQQRKHRFANPISFEEWKTKIKSEIARKEAYAEKVKRRIENYPHLEGRRIIETYESVLEPDTIIVLVEGTESGTAWTIQEYEEQYG